jgi:hypothetical protein
MGLIVVVMGIVDNFPVLGRYRQQIVVLDSAVTDEAELISRLERLLDAKVHSARPQRIDLINDSTVVDVRYVRSSRRSMAPVSPAAYGASR